jgi:hypothetical protein
VGILPYLEYGRGMAAALDGDPATAVAAFAEALGLARQTGQRSLVAYALLGIAVTAGGLGQYPEAAALHGAADALFEELREAPEPLEARLREQALGVLRAQLGGQFEREYTAGQGLDTPAAVELAVTASHPPARPMPALPPPAVASRPPRTDPRAPGT